MERHVARLKVRQRPECSHCGQVIYSCRGCKREFTPGTEIECVDNPHDGLPWGWKHYCKSCAKELLT
jgi:hypothetical protein